MKRSPATTITAQIAAMANASKPPLDPPAHVSLRAGDRPFWDGIIRSRARSDWDEADMVVAAQLARCQADIEAEQKMMDGEDHVVKNGRGNDVVNPRLNAIEYLARREMALMRTLRMGGKVAGSAQLQGVVRDTERQAKRTFEEIEDEELLA